MDEQLPQPLHFATPTSTNSSSNSNGHTTSGCFTAVISHSYPEIDPSHDKESSTIEAKAKSVKEASNVALPPTPAATMSPSIDVASLDAQLEASRQVAELTHHYVQQLRSTGEIFWSSGDAAKKWSAVTFLSKIYEELAKAKVASFICWSFMTSFFIFTKRWPLPCPQVLKAIFPSFSIAWSF